ncbi:hypothetical protein L9F63_007061, partial [Diploptera punctata]
QPSINYFSTPLMFSFQLFILFKFFLASFYVFIFVVCVHTLFSGFPSQNQCG